MTPAVTPSLLLSDRELWLALEARATIQSRPVSLVVSGAGITRTTGAMTQHSAADGVGRHSVSFPGTAKTDPPVLNGTTL